MGKNTDAGRDPKKRVDAAAKARFLTGLRDGLKRDEAAAQAGFTANAFYQACRRDPVFALARTMALALSAADGRAARAVRALPGTGEITPTGGRRLQRRHVRRPRFDDRRKRLFLDHFAGTADAHAACAAAGIAYSTYTQHRRKDPVFAAACAEAVAIAYAAMEEEAVCRRLAAQRDLRDGICPAGEADKEFDRLMQLLARFDRKDGRIGLRELPHGSRQRADIWDAIAEADRKLRAIGARHGIEAEPVPIPRTDEDGEEDGDGRA